MHGALVRHLHRLLLQCRCTHVLRSGLHELEVNVKGQELLADPDCLAIM